MLPGAAITLLNIGAAVFFLVVKPVNLMIDRFRLSPASPSRAAKTCPDCFTDIPAKARRCPNCTSELSRPAVKRHRRPHKKGGTMAGKFVQQKGSTGKYHFNLGGW